METEDAQAGMVGRPPGTLHDVIVRGIEKKKDQGFPLAEAGRQVGFPPHSFTR